MIGIASAALVHAGWRDACYLLQQASEICRILLARARLFLEPRHLRQEQRGLKFGHPQVRAGVLIRKVCASIAASAAVVMEAITGLEQRLIVGQDRATLAGVQVLTRLKAETSRSTVGAD